MSDGLACRFRPDHNDTRAARHLTGASPWEHWHPILRDVVMIDPRHIRHHGRFYCAALAGLALWLAAWAMHWPLPPLIGGDAFFLIYIALMVRFAMLITPDGLRQRAGIEEKASL